jgi:hypothetical protein
MDAAPNLIEIADAFAAVQLEAILIGSAGAALHGAPVTTMDFDFLYRVSPSSRAKLDKLAERLGAALTQPFPLTSTVFRIRRVDPALQVNLIAKVHRVRSFDSLHRRASAVEVAGRNIVVASLADLSGTMRYCMSLKKPLKKSEKAPRKRTKRERELELMRQQSEQDLVDMIRANLALPMHKRTHFLRVPLPNGGSAL